MSLMLEIFDLGMLAKTGRNVLIINFLAQVMNYLSQYLLTVVFIFLAHGWTISIFSIEDFELSLPIMVLIGILKVLVIGLGRISSEDHDYFHRYDGIAFYLILVFQIGLFVFFIVGIVKRMRQRPGLIQKNFFKEIAICGSIYFLIVPSILVFSKFLRPSSQNLFIEIGMLVSHFVSVLFFFLVTLRNDGYYMEILKGGFSLPGKQE